MINPELTWTCHVCGKKRPDDKISVHTTEKWFGTVKGVQNVRYCNDNPECFEGAKKIEWLPDE